MAASFSLPPITFATCRLSCQVFGLPSRLVFLANCIPQACGSANQPNQQVAQPTLKSSPVSGWFAPLFPFLGPQPACPSRDCKGQSLPPQCPFWHRRGKLQRAELREKRGLGTASSIKPRPLGFQTHTSKLLPQSLRVIPLLFVHLFTSPALALGTTSHRINLQPLPPQLYLHLVSPARLPPNRHHGASLERRAQGRG